MKLIGLRTATAVLLCIIVTAFSEKTIMAHGGYTTPFAGVGFSYDYSWDKNDNDQTGYITAKYGAYSFFSHFLTVDVGRRIKDKELVYRIGGEAYIGPGVLGIHAGISNKYEMGSGDFTNGKSISYGVTSALLFNPSLFVIAGQEKINNNTHENFIRASLMYNFRTGIKFRY